MFSYINVKKNVIYVFKIEVFNMFFCSEYNLCICLIYMYMYMDRYIFKFCKLKFLLFL